jgi:hypothetical protein
MDTDYLTEKAYDVLIIESGKVSEFLCAEIGASARDYPDEYSYLKATLEILKEIVEDPMDYLESWNLEEEVDCEKFNNDILMLKEKVTQVMDTPIKDRGAPSLE